MLDSIGTKSDRGYNMHTYTGKRVFPLDLREEDIDIIDIAHSLSLQNRYNGHVKFPYSVAQHSIIMSQMVAPNLALEALLHDASEAYCGDMIRPLKAVMPEFKNVELQIEKTIRNKFGLPETQTPEIKQADVIMAFTERRDVLLPSSADWGPAVEPFKTKIFEMHWQDVKYDFLRLFQTHSSFSGGPPSRQVL